MKSLKLTLKLLFFLLIISCTDNETPENIISDNNLKLLKQESLSKLQSFKNSRNFRINYSNINFDEIHQILNNTNPDEITYDNLENLLGVYYNHNYFNNLKNIDELSLSIINSNYFENNVSIEQKRYITEEVLVYAFENNTVDLFEVFGSDSLENCLNKAEADHKRRLAFFASTGAAQAAAGAFSGGVSIFTGGVTWIGGSIYSGIQYDADVEYCNEQFND